MKIDSRIEPLVRHAFAGAIHRNPDEFEEAVRSIGSAGDDTASKAANLALRICMYAFLDIHGGSSPDDDQVQELARSFCEMEEWASPDLESATRFLSALAKGVSLESVLLPEQIVLLEYLLGGWLLAAFVEKPWTDYLDDILDDLEGQPAQ